MVRSDKILNKYQLSGVGTPTESIHAIHLACLLVCSHFSSVFLLGHIFYSSVHEPCMVVIGPQYLLEECIHNPRVLALVSMARGGQQRVAECCEGSRAPQPLPLPASYVLFCRQMLSSDASVP